MRRTEAAKVRGTLEELGRVERRIIRATGRLQGGPGQTGLAVALEHLSGMREGLSQAEEELEIDDGLYLTEPPTDR